MFKFHNWGTLTACLAVAALTVLGSIWQGQYVVDHLHWGLMLGNAKDLSMGLIPYKDIYILYGFLTTLVHAFAYSWLGGNLKAIISVTALAYAVGLSFIYVLCLQITKDKRLALYAIFTCFLFHPIAIYPWSNYIAFPLLLLGLILQFRANTLTSRIVSGIFFGLAVLAREGLAPAVGLYLILCGVVDYFANKDSLRHSFLQTSLSLLGLVIPIAMMLSYLWLVGALPYWHDISWHLPKLYAREFFPHMTGLQLLAPLGKQLALGFATFDVRWVLVGLIILTNIGTLAIALLRKKYRAPLQANIKLSIFSLLLFSSSLHLAELFRISTGSIVGIINIYYLLKKINAHHIAFVLITSLLLFSIVPKGSGHAYSTTNYFFPSQDTINAAGPVLSPRYFIGQRWGIDARDFYQSIDKDLTEILKVCAVKFHYNQTYDAFLQLLSPFKKSQLAPFYLSEQMESLRPDLDWKKKTGPNADLVIFKHVAPTQGLAAEIPENFVLYKKYSTPRTNFLYRGDYLLIIIPTHCALALQAK
jgi:hypothetical protein